MEGIAQDRVDRQRGHAQSIFHRRALRAHFVAQFRAAQLQDWEDQVMEEAMRRNGSEEGVQVVLRGGVRGAQGTRATQSMMFRVRPEECVEMTIALHNAASSSSTLPETSEK